MELVADAHSAHPMQHRNAKSTFRCVLKANEIPICLVSCFSLTNYILAYHAC